MSESEDENEVDNETGQLKTEEEVVKTMLSQSMVQLKNLIPNSPLKSESALKVGLWILSSHSKKKSSTSIMQRIRWLTAVVQYGIVDSLTDLEKLFNPLIQLIFISQYHASICHLLYMIATPNLYKFQVERITKNANIMGLTNPLVGLMSRLKSLRPDLVPQTIPHQSNAISFPKAPISIRNGFYALSERIKDCYKLPNRITFSIEIERKRATKKMKLDIIPRVQHINLKSSFEIDFRKMVLLSQLQTFDDVLKKITTVALPNHVGSLLNKREYHYVLSLNFTPRMEALLSQWLYLTLFHEFMEKRQNQGREEKTLLLNRIIEFQESTGRKLMVVYDFLAEYLPTWDGLQYGDQIFRLLSGIPFLPSSDLLIFLRILENLLKFSPTSQKMKIIDCCRKLIYNLLLQQFGPADQAKLLFQSSNKTSSLEEKTKIVEGIYVISEIIRFTKRLWNSALTSSINIALILNSLLFHLWLMDVESEFDLPFRTMCQPITVYAALFSPAPVAVSLLCQLLCKFKESGLSQLIAKTTLVELTDFLQESLQDASLLNRYVADTSSCLIYQKAFHGNSLLSRLPPGNIKKLSQLGYLKVAFDLKKHPAFTGIARRWIKSKSIRSDDDSLDVFQEIDNDSDGYIRFLFCCFPAIRDYIQQFHRD
uniref:Centromere protein I n=1 Tax=Daphnia galeata TaxID=27404 RepID=A0A8J2RTS7_9CRUS|nr:unnamed protein product [Daphnia galeata]